MEGILKRCAYAQPAQSRPRGRRGTETKPLKHCQTTKKAESLPCLSHLAHHGRPPQTHSVLARATLLSGVSPAPTAQPWASFPGRPAWRLRWSRRSFRTWILGCIPDGRQRLQGAPWLKGRMQATSAKTPAEGVPLLQGHGFCGASPSTTAVSPVRSQISLRLINWDLNVFLPCENLFPLEQCFPNVECAPESPGNPVKMKTLISRPGLGPKSLHV